MTYFQHPEQTFRRTSSTSASTDDSVGMSAANTWSIAASSAARVAQIGSTRSFPAIAAMATAAPVNWESIRQYSRR
jgi:hypothetical protein